MFPQRYGLESLQRAVSDPRLITQEIKQIFDITHNRYKKFRIGPADNFLDDEWDNLIILDACRIDAFEQVNWLDGEMQSRVSIGSTSKEFIQKTFIGEELHDTVYITANPYFAMVEPDTFHAVITLLEDWNEEDQTVRPEIVANKTKQVYKKYNNKKLIVHFMQPHHPYLGEKSSEIRSKIESLGEFSGYNPEKRASYNHGVSSLDGISQRKAAKHPKLDVTREDVWEAYLETLQIALEQVEWLHQTLGGRTVITADHGEMLGESRNIFSDSKYGHPGGWWTEELRIVPWFIIESTTRREIIAEPPDRYDTIGEDKLNDRLKALGYR